ncbi:MAG: hypothetical protein V4659_11730 [Pseudomonadota bacterium]
MKAVAVLLALAATPALAAHNGVATARTGPEPSDIALFVMAALGVWLVRRALRARFASASQED